MPRVTCCPDNTIIITNNCEREGTHFVEVDPGGTTKECAECVIETEKPV